MLKFIIFISKFLSLCQQTFISVFRVLLMSKSAKNYRKQTVNSDRIVILGNGPSFKRTYDENKDFFFNNELICVNYFASSEYYSELKPKYYVAIDNVIFKDNAAQHYVDARNKLFSDIAEKTTWPLKFIISHEAKSYKIWQDLLKGNENIEIIYMNVTPVEGFKLFRYHWYYHGRGLSRPHNVLIPAIFFAMNAKVKEIILVGADHSWFREIHVDDNNNAYVSFKHFYDIKENQEEVNNATKASLKLHGILSSFSNAFESYHVIEKYTKSRGVKILNCTPKSFIDAFERSRISELK